MIGGAGTDIADYSASGSAITGGTISGTSGTITDATGTDTLSGFEEYQLTAQGDLLTFDVDALASATINASGGADEMSIIDGAGTNFSSGGGINGVDLATIFDNVESFDFSGASLSGADVFVIGDDDIAGITSAASSTLEITLDGINIALADVTATAQQSTITSDVTSGSLRTVDWADGTQLLLYG